MECCLNKNKQKWVAMLSEKNKVMTYTEESTTKYNTKVDCLIFTSESGSWISIAG